MQYELRRSFSHSPDPLTLPPFLPPPQVGISSVWWEGNPCNMHLNDLALEVKLGVEDCGLVGLRFNTIGVSDGISMGTDGMSFSLQSRDLIADSIETVMGAQWYDANISLPGCDKNMPGTLIAMARLNRPSLMIYGGTIKPGHSSGDATLDIVSAFQSYGGFAAGLISDEERQDIVRNSCPGPGACGGMYTANTMATAIEALGMALPYSSSTPAEDAMKRVECRMAGRYVLELMKRDIKPRDVMTRAAFENAMVVVMATGGSTNAVLHLIAMAAAAGLELTLDDFQRVSNRTPFIADLKPSGKYVMEDVHKVRLGDVCTPEIQFLARVWLPFFCLRMGCLLCGGYGPLGAARRLERPVTPSLYPLPTLPPRNERAAPRSPAMKHRPLHSGDTPPIFISFSFYSVFCYLPSLPCPCPPHPPLPPFLSTPRWAAPPPS